MFGHRKWKMLLLPLSCIAQYIKAFNAEPLAGNYVNRFDGPLFVQVQWSLVWLV